MAFAVEHAKRNHPGWRNRTGTAERSVRIVTPARKVGFYIGGVWGSVGVIYVQWLEQYHGEFLLNAANAARKELAGNVRRAIRSTFRSR